MTDGVDLDAGTCHGTGVVADMSAGNVSTPAADADILCADMSATQPSDAIAPRGTAL